MGFLLSHLRYPIDLTSWLTDQISSDLYSLEDELIFNSHFHSLNNGTDGDGLQWARQFRWGYSNKCSNTYSNMLSHKLHVLHAIQIFHYTLSRSQWNNAKDRMKDALSNSKMKLVDLLIVDIRFYLIVYILSFGLKFYK